MTQLLLILAILTTWTLVSIPLGMWIGRRMAGRHLAEVERQRDAAEDIVWDYAVHGADYEVVLPKRVIQRRGRIT